MAGVFQPPPTWALPVIVDEMTGKAIFNPVWLRWFVDFSANVGTGGAGSGSVISVNTKTGVVTLTAADVGAGGLATDNHWTGPNNFDLLETAGFVFIAGAGGGIAPKVTLVSTLGTPGLRWLGVYGQDLDLAGTFKWGAYTIPVPAGATTTYLRNDGTWATPPDTTGAQLDVANTWTALQTFNADIRTPTFGTVVGYGVAPTVTDTYENGDAAFRWLNTITKNLTLGENLVWNALTIPKPTGGTTTFLRNDGTWAAPAGGVSLDVANTWTAKQTFNGGLESEGYLFVAGVGGGLAAKVTGQSTLGTPSLRWISVYSQDADITGNFKWGTVNPTAIPPPAGSTTTFLRNDGTWATPPAGISLGAANTWTAKQTFSAEWATSVLQTFDVASGTPGLQPLTDNQSQLGTASLRWKQIYTKLLNCSGDFTWGAYTIPVPTGDTTKFLRNDGTWTASIPGIQQVGGIVKTTGTSIGALGGGFTSIVSYNAAAYSNAAGISHNLTNGTVTISVAGDYNFIVNMICLYDASTSDRAFGVRIWDATSSVSIGGTTVGAPPDSTALSVGFTLPIVVAAGRLTHPLVLQIGDGSTFANFTVGAATLAATSIGPLS